MVSVGASGDGAGGRTYRSLCGLPPQTQGQQEPAGGQAHFRHSHSSLAPAAPSAPARNPRSVRTDWHNLEGLLGRELELGRSSECPSYAGALGWRESFYKSEAIEKKKRTRTRKKKLFFPPPSPPQSRSLGSTLPSVGTCKLSALTSYKSTFLALFPAPPPPSQHWGIWVSLRHCFTLHRQPAREWRSVIWGRETLRSVDWTPQVQPPKFLICSFATSLNGTISWSVQLSLWFELQSHFQTDLSWDYFLLSGWISEIWCFLLLIIRNIFFFFCLCSLGYWPLQSKCLWDRVSIYKQKMRKY